MFDPKMCSIEVKEYCVYPAIERGIVDENTSRSVFMAPSHVIDLARGRLIVLARRELKKNACAPAGKRIH